MHNIRIYFLKNTSSNFYRDVILNDRWQSLYGDLVGSDTSPSLLKTQAQVPHHGRKKRCWIALGDHCMGHYDIEWALVISAVSVSTLHIGWSLAITGHIRWSLAITGSYTPRNEVEGGYTGFTLFVRPSVCPSVRPSAVGVPMITWILFIRFQFFWHMYHLGEDLGWYWIWASYLIKYVHNGWSCDLGIFGIPEVNFFS